MPPPRPSYQPVLSRPCVDYAVGMFNQNRLKFILAELGHERIIYSEDYPYVESESVSEFLESAELSEDQRASIAHRNAQNLLHI